MLARVLSTLVALVLISTVAEARRVALVIGQNAYTAGWQPLANPRRDAERMAALLTKHGFEVIACDSTAPGCFDLTHESLTNAAATLKARAAGAELALVFYAGHGGEGPQGNVLAATDSDFDCQTLAVRRGVLVNDFLDATAPARHKIVILDACRNNPLAIACPLPKGAKALSFARIEPGGLRDFLLVTSTQFGQEALDGPPDTHSPFATALLNAFEESPSVYFDQVLNQVARATYEAAQQQRFTQIPGRVVGGEAPAECLAGKGCIGDARMTMLAIENEKLAAESAAAQADAAGVRNLIAAEERSSGKPYTAEERQKRIAELGVTLAKSAKLGWPVQGRIVQGFAPRVEGRGSDGIVVAVPVGTDVLAAEGGIVAYAGSDLKAYGNLVLVRHDSGLVTAYANNDRILVQRGDRVRRGQPIAKAGVTGDVDQPSLHFEVRVGSKPVDPLLYLEKR
jgi:murein DD-endopeptidase MepM/ murein hydrolase activator NlpD